MFHKVLMTGGVALLAVSALGATAHAQEQSRAPVPTTPTTLSVGDVTTTSTTQPATSVERSSDDNVASTGPHDYVAWVSLAGVASLALGVSLRGKRADGNHWRS
jgi:hypothetical protein